MSEEISEKRLEAVLGDLLDSRASTRLPRKRDLEDLDSDARPKRADEELKATEIDRPLGRTRSPGGGGMQHREIPSAGHTPPAQTSAQQFPTSLLFGVVLEATQEALISHL